MRASPEREDAELPDRGRCFAFNLATNLAQM